MAKYSPEDIRNIVLCGHAHSGKTMLAEAMLLKAGALSRLGSITEGTTVSDFDVDEKSRGHSITSSVMHCNYDGHEFNIIDTPGSMPFVGGMISGVEGADLAIICINAQKGVEIMARKAWDMAGQMGLGRMVVITRMDAENVNYLEVLDAVQKAFCTTCVPFTIPDGEGETFKGVTRIMDEANSGEEVEARRLHITESAVECDDELCEKYLEGAEVTHQQVVDVLQTAIADGHIVPVFCLSAEKDIGVEEIMHGVAEWGTDPMHAHHHALSMENPEEEVAFKADPDGPLCAQVFKIVSDPHVGKLTYFRVFSGKLASKSTAYVSTGEKKEKFAQLFKAQGEGREDLDVAIAGDIAVVSKIESLHMGDTIYDKEFHGFMKKAPFPVPMAGLAISAKNTGDEQKIGINLHRMCEEDPTFIFERNELTGEQVIRGIGALHLDVMLGRLKSHFNMEVNTKVPKIPYLETLSKQAEGRYRHRKQSGGSGQFGEVWLRVKPNTRGEGFDFVNSISGGVISAPFIPSVEKGIKGAMDKGPVAGYPLVDVVVELYDGKEHPVDSKDIAFQMAGRNGFLEIIPNCKPVLLEPIVDMEIVFPAQYTGDISGDIATRRGRPTGMDQLGDMQLLKAQVPLAEVASYGSTLSAITQGEGMFSMELSHYDSVPSSIASQVAAKAKAAAE